MRLAGALLALLLGVCASPIGAADPAPEPEGFWTGPMQGAVPATIAGGKVVTTGELEALISSAMPALVDVGPLPHKPDNLAAEAWIAPPHRTIPYSVWLPGVGKGELAPDVEGWYRAWLTALTDGDLSKPIVIFCHPNCWGSWNAAKRAILYGYKAVHWYPGGIEGWQESGHQTQAVEPETPPQ
ncbi:MAG: rhodanese-like domain-containing protein [Dongiaceae bacterium]